MLIRSKAKIPKSRMMIAETRFFGMSTFTNTNQKITLLLISGFGYPLHTPVGDPVSFLGFAP
jgi:hypothetical protein